MECAWKVEDARRLLRNVAWTEQFNWQLIALAAFDGVFLRGDGMRDCFCGVQGNTDL